MAKSRGGDDGPKISMRVEKGKLVPLSQHDFELLDSWREGAIVNVSPVLASTRVTERRYFAMLSKLIKTAETPWRTTLEAHEAIKLATGFVEPVMKKGQWATESRHISTFTDAELEEYFELFCGIVQQRFGIDPQTLRKEAPDIGIHESSDVGLRPGVDDGPDASPIPVGVGEPSPSALAPATEDEPEADEDTPVPSSARGPLNTEDMAWLKKVARMLVGAVAPGGDVSVLDRQWAAILRYETPKAISQDARAIARKILAHCDASMTVDGKFDKAWIANMAGCRPEDLRAEAR